MVGACIKLKEFRKAIPFLREIVCRLRGKNSGDRGPLVDIQLEEHIVLRVLGQCLTQVGDVREGAEFFFESLRLDPDGEATLRDLAAAHEKIGDPRLGVTHFEQLNRLRPGNVQIVLGLAVHFWGAWRRDSAFGLVDEALSLDPANADAHALKARWNMESGGEENARKALAEAEARGVCSFPLEQCGLDLAMRARDFTRARHHIDRMVGLVPPEMAPLKLQLLELAEKLASV